MALTVSTGLPIDLANPVARDHGLNYRRLAWWKFLPNWDGGQTFWDLLGSWPGTLTNFGGTTSGWRGTSCPGASGELRFDLTQQAYVLVSGSSTGPLALTDNFTVACRFKVVTGGLQGLLVRYHAGGDNSAFLRLNGANVDFGGGTSITATGVVADSLWYSVLATVSGGSAVIYLNGIAVASGSVSISAGTSPWHLGHDFDSSGRYFNGALDDCSIWGRPFSASGALQWHLETADGCPETLNRPSVPIVVKAPLTVAVAGSSSVILAATAAESRVTSQISSPSVVLSAEALESGVFHRSGPASVVLLASAVPGRVALGTGAAQVLLHAVASQYATLVRSEDTLATVVLRANSSATGGPQTATTTSSALVIMRARVGLLRKLLEFPGSYLGRFQAGQEVPLGLDVLDRRGSLTVPSDGPTVRVYRDGVLVRTLRQPREFDSADDTRFFFPFVLGREDSPGRYAVVFYYGASGVVRVGLDLFEVVLGGDPGGPVIAAHTLARPQSDRVVVHLGSGVLVSGTSPYLDEGV